MFQPDGHPVEHYAQELKKLRHGDTVIFSSGEKFRIGQALGEGSHTVIFPVLDENGQPNGQALRLAKETGYHPVQRGESFQSLLMGFAESQPFLEKSGVPVVKLYPEESQPAEYVVVEYLNIKFRYDEFLNRSGRAKNLSPDQYERALADFIKFGVDLWRYRTLSDQLPQQIGYVPDRGWVLFDFNRFSSLALYVKNGTPFSMDNSMVYANHHAVKNGELGAGDKRLPLPHEPWARKKIFDGIDLKRREAGLPSSFCSELLQDLGTLLRNARLRFSRSKKAPLLGN